MRKKTKDMNKYRKEWYQNNKEKHKKTVHEYQKINEIKLKLRQKEYRMKHPEKQKEWSEKNLERRREINRKSAKKRYDMGIGKEYKDLYKKAEVILREKHKEEFNRIFAKLKHTALREGAKE